MRLFSEVRSSNSFRIPVVLVSRILCCAALEVFERQIIVSISTISSVSSERCRQQVVAFQNLFV